MTDNLAPRDARAGRTAVDDARAGKTAVDDAYSRTLYVCAFSARTIARAAALSGLNVWAIDAFADRDLRACAHHWRNAAPTPGPLRRAVAAYDRMWNRTHQKPLPPLLYGSGIEHWPDTVALWEENRTVLGNSGRTLGRLDNPRRFLAGMRRCGLLMPDTSLVPPIDQTGTWLSKDRHLSGGTGVRIFAPDQTMTPSIYYQRRIRGISQSLLFLADRKGAYPITLTRQWHDGGHDGGHNGGHDGGPLSPMRYGGACRKPIAPAHHDHWRRIADTVTRIFDLRGLNSLDFMQSPSTDDPSLENCRFLEVNPRIGASLCLFSPSKRADLLQCHIRACQGSDAGLDLADHGKIHAHAILYAGRDITVGKRSHTGSSKSYTPSWPPWAEDIPTPGKRIRRGAPICSVRASGIQESDATRLVFARKKALSAIINAAPRPQPSFHHPHQEATHDPLFQHPR